MTKKQKEKEKTPHELFLESIKKAFGKESPIIDTSDEEALEIEKFSSGSLLLDQELKGGWPKGRIAELYGPEGSGKTTTSIHAVAEFLRKYPDEYCLWLDQEKVFDPVYFETIGIDWRSENFILTRCHSGEDAYETMINFTKFHKGGIIIVDSVATLLPSAEDEKDMGAATMGSQARLNSQGLRKLLPHLSKSNTTLFFINQVREKLGVTFGDPETTPGGKAIKFYARTRVRVSSKKSEDDSSAKAGYILKKANYGNVGGKVETNILYGIGFDRVSEVLTVAVEAGLIEVNGSWYSYEGTKLGQGFNGLKLAVEDNINLYQEIEQKVLEYVGL